MLRQRAYIDLPFVPVQAGTQRYNRCAESKD
jgi:hypothetical protein